MIQPIIKNQHIGNNQNRYLIFILSLLLTTFLVACDLGGMPAQTPTPTSTGIPTATAMATLTSTPAYLSSARIVFVVYRDGSSEIYVMNADGSRVTRLTYNSAYDLLPTWSPEGTKILFQSERDGNDEIYVMNADGSGVTRLTDNPATSCFPFQNPMSFLNASASKTECSIETNIVRAKK